MGLCAQGEGAAMIDLSCFNGQNEEKIYTRSTVLEQLFLLVLFAH